MDGWSLGGQLYLFYVSTLSRDLQKGVLTSADCTVWWSCKPTHMSRTTEVRIGYWDTLYISFCGWYDNFRNPLLHIHTCSQPCRDSTYNIPHPRRLHLLHRQLWRFWCHSKNNLVRFSFSLELKGNLNTVLLSGVVVYVYIVFLIILSLQKYSWYPW